MSDRTTSVVQDSIGFIWVGTDKGLYRYDGHHFDAYLHIPGKTEEGNGLLRNTVATLYVDRKGRLWCSLYQGGMNRYMPEQDRFAGYKYYSEGDSAKSIRPCFYFMELADGTLMVRDVDDNTLVYNEVKDCFEPYEPFQKEKDSRQRALPVAIDSLGRIWAVKNKSIGYANPGEDVFNALFPVIGWVNDIDFGPDGWIWIGTWGNGIYRYHEPSDQVVHFSVDPTNPNGLASDIVLKFILDSRKQYWLITNGGPLYLEHGFQPLNDSIFHFNRLRLSESESYITERQTMIEDRDGRCWFSYMGAGLYLWDPHAMPYNLRQPSFFGQSAVPDNMFEDRSGSLWTRSSYRVSRRNTVSGENQTIDLKAGSREAIVGGWESFFYQMSGDDVYLQHFVHGTSRLQFKDGILRQSFYRDSIKGILATLHDQSDNLWFSTYRGVYRCPVQVRNPSIRDLETILENWDGREMAVDKEGYIWVGSWDQGLVRINPRTFEKEFLNPLLGTGRGLVGQATHRVQSTNDGWVWVMTSDGLNGYNPETKHFEFFGPNSNFPIQLASTMTKDRKDRLWFAIPGGLCIWDTKLHKGQVLDKSFGLPNWTWTKLLITQNDVLYALSDKGVLELNLNDIPVTPIPMKVNFKSIRIEGRELVRQESLIAKEKIALSYRDNLVRIDFSTLDFSQLGKFHFQYRMSGVSDQWINLGTDPSITLLDPPNGKRKLEVRALNALGQSSAEVASLQMIIRPPWWLSHWAFAGYVLCVLVGSWRFAQWRNRQLIQRQLELENTVSERTREIAQERDRSENLLLNILPEETARELKEKGHSEARLFAQATVLFTDFAGFTALSEAMGPTELVSEINECFSAFDKTMEEYGLEKIKTIGDAYMAAGGLPEPARGSAVDAVLAALKMQSYIQQRFQENARVGKPGFSMRIGLHTGSVVAGIVGIKKFQYDIWGDTVNIASRMESSGAVGKVNISEATYQLVCTDPRFQFEARGHIQAKGKGEMEMYFVEAIS